MEVFKDEITADFEECDMPYCVCGVAAGGAVGIRMRTGTVRGSTLKRMSVGHQHR